MPTVHCFSVAVGFLTLVVALDPQIVWQEMAESLCR